MSLVIDGSKAGTALSDTATQTLSNKTLVSPVITGTASTDTITESTGAAYSTYTPTVTADSGTWGTPTINLARYRILGKTLFLHINLSVSVSSGSPSEMRIQLPAGRSGATLNPYSVCSVSNAGAGEIGLARQRADTFVAVQRQSGLFSGACAATFAMIVELA